MNNEWIINPYPYKEGKFIRHNVKHSPLDGYSFFVRYKNGITHCPGCGAKIPETLMNLIRFV